MARDKKYERMIKAINLLREELKKNPNDRQLKSEVDAKEEELYQYVVRSSNVLDDFMRSERESNPDWLDVNDGL